MSSRPRSGLIRGYSEPAGVAPRPGGTAAPSDPEAPRWGASETPELRSTPSPIEVVVSRSASNRMLDDLFWSTRSDSLESGGFLFSWETRPWKKQVTILHSTWTGDAHRSPDSLSLDVQMWKNAETAFAIDGREMQLCGLWHCHPRTRDGTPSETDMRSLAAVLAWHEEHGRSLPCAVGLIYAADERLGDTWARPALHCWTVRWDGRDRWARLLCEPATVRTR